MILIAIRLEGPKLVFCPVYGLIASQHPSIPAAIKCFVNPLKNLPCGWLRSILRD